MIKKFRGSLLRSPFLYLILAIILFVAAVLVFQKSQNSDVSDEFSSELLTENISKELELVAIDFNAIEPNLIRIKNLHSNPVTTRYPFVVIQNERLVFWSDFHFLPRTRELRGDYYLKVINEGSSFYLLVKFARAPGLETIFIVPLLKNYSIVNQNLRSSYNDRIFQSDNFDISIASEDGFQEILIGEDSLFYVRFHNTYPTTSGFMKHLTETLFVISFVLFALFLYKRTTFLFYGKHFFYRGHFQKGLLGLIFWLVGVRALMIFFNFPFSFYPIELFNPRNYASSVFNPSLGDLLLNVLTITIILLIAFKNYYRFQLVRMMLSGPGWKMAVLSVLFVVVNLSLVSLFYVLVNSLNFHSQWSLDITRELNFHLLKSISFLILLFGGLSYFLFCHVLIRIYCQLNKRPKEQLLYLAIGTAVFLCIAIYDNWEYKVIVTSGGVYLVVVRVFNLFPSLTRIQYLTFVYFFVGSLFVSFIGAYSMYTYQSEKLVSEKNRLAGQLLVENDVLTEFLLNEAGNQIAEDVFIQNRIFNPYVSKINIKQRVQRVYLNNQLEKYDVDVKLFNSRGTPLEESGKNLNELLEEFKEFQIDSTLYFVNRFKENTIKRYLKKVEIKRYSRIAGYVLIDLKLRRIIPNSVYPMLLIDNRYSGPDIASSYSYAIYENNNLIFNTGQYSYPDKIDSRMKQLGKSKLGYKKDGLSHFTIQGENERTYIISLQAYPLRNVFSNFSFLFVIFLGAILLTLIFFTVSIRLRGKQLNYASRIQLFLNAAFLTPLIIIAISAISVIVKSYNENLEIENKEKANNISLKLSESLESYLARETNKETFSEVINEISQFADIDINIFGNNGRLIASSQPLIYENELLAELINPKAYAGIFFNNESSMVLEERIGSLHYNNTYSAIKSLESGQQIGILSLPYFDVRRELEENVINVLTSVMNIFFIIFMIFLVLSYLGSLSLTFPLKLITQKIRKTNLLETNEPLDWQSNDEIGLMIGEYNKMLENLEESKEALARSEKESAWREIARQVAHEIKNPLTPMQLTLQHMRRTLEEDQVDKEKRISQIDALLHQITTLSDIATSFSAFAKMPVPQNQPFNLSELLSETFSLYDKKELVKIHLDLENKEFVVNADRKWMGQAVSNIIINGMHAAEEMPEALIDISLRQKTDKKCVLTISDNGKGIPEDIQNKIFIPNFSTKEKGSGIGLAVAKRAVEHAGGEIWFETEEGKGTSFYIEIPLVS